MGSAGPCHGQGVWEESSGDPRRRRQRGDVPEREISHSGQATRSHASSCPHSASTGFTRPPSRSFHLGASAPFSPSLSFVRPLLQAQPRIPIPVCSLDAQIAAGPVPRSRSRRTTGAPQHGGRPRRGGSGQRGSPGAPSLPARSLRNLVPTCQRRWAPTLLPTRVAEVCNLQPQPA